ncbi:MAG: tripartite tricarboxylate transporter substrate binding protein [Betaproteobacteria bacterium]|nr:tripartite tricarboxylate transporter substrate binding protein [Betaproteobacteria bacterium]
MTPQFKGLAVLAWALALALTAFGTAAQQYPQRPIRMIAAQSPGSSLDTILRIFAAKMSELIGQPIVIDNRGGAGGTLGVELAARAPTDGYTLLIGASSSMIVSSYTYKKLPFDTLKDFAPISLFANVEAVMVVNPTVPAKSVKDLIALAKAQPGKFNMGSAGMGSSSHLAGLLFVSFTGINTVHVPYKGGGPMAAAVIANEAHWAISPAAALVSHIKAGRLRALAISSAQRSPILPELPTVAEAGVPGYDFGSWTGVLAPAGTPRAIIKHVHGVMVKVAPMQDVRDQFAAQGLAPTSSASPEAFAKLIRDDFTSIGKLVKMAGIKPE